jgi:hypothetical protein
LKNLAKAEFRLRLSSHKALTDFISIVFDSGWYRKPVLPFRVIANRKPPLPICGDLKTGAISCAGTESWRARQTIDQETIVGQLAKVTGDLIPSGQTTANDIERARVAVALAAANGQTEAFFVGTPVIGSGEPDAATTQILKEIARRALEAALQPQLVVRREFVSRVPPFPNPEPTQIGGRAVVDTHGPFLDRLGRPVWIDVLSILPFVGVVREGSTQPFLYVAITPALPPATRCGWVRAVSGLPRQPLHMAHRRPDISDCA